MKKILIIILCFSVFYIGNAFSAEVSWMYVQHRAYADGRSINRLGFGVINDQGQYISNESFLTDVKLYGPNGKLVKISPLKFSALKEIYGFYDAKNSQWDYPKDWQFSSSLSADILESLEPGFYRLSIANVDGKVSERTFQFNKQIDLPIIDSNSIQLHLDSIDNLVWTWAIPTELGRLAFNYKTRAKASIDIYKNNINVGYFSIILPTHLGYVFVPHEVVRILNQKGDRFELKIKLETRDKNNRTYSNPLIVSEMLPPVSTKK